MILNARGEDARTERWSEPAPLGLQECASSYALGRTWRSADGEMSVIASVDDGSLHVSIANRSRYPTWQEILAVRSWGFPDDCEVVMVLARRGEYVNVHPNCFHLWESACGREGR